MKGSVSQLKVGLFKKRKERKSNLLELYSFYFRFSYLILIRNFKKRKEKENLIVEKGSDKRTLIFPLFQTAKQTRKSIHVLLILSFLVRWKSQQFRFVYSVALGVGQTEKSFSFERLIKSDAQSFKGLCNSTSICVILQHVWAFSSKVNKFVCWQVNSSTFLLALGYLTQTSQLSLNRTQLYLKLYSKSQRFQK